MFQAFRPISSIWRLPRVSGAIRFSLLGLAALSAAALAESRALAQHLWDEPTQVAPWQNRPGARTRPTVVREQPVQEATAEVVARPGTSKARQTSAQTTSTRSTRKSRVRPASAEVVEGVPVPPVADGPAAGAGRVAAPAPQPMPGEYVEPGPGCASCGGGHGGPDCYDGCVDGWCDPYCGWGCGPCWLPLHNRLWVQTEYMLWWMQGFGVPPLVTTSINDPDVEDAGVLGQEDTRIAFGANGMNDRVRSAGRVTFGLWLDPCQTVGVQASYLGIGRQSTTFHAESDADGNPIIARPFFNIRPTVADPVDPNQNPREASYVIAYPDYSQGSVDVRAGSELHGAEVLWRRRWFDGCDGRLDFLAGYRFNRLDDDLSIASVNTGLEDHPTPGVTFRVFDVFQTDNQFHGGELGLAGQWRYCRSTIDLLLKLAIGNTHTRVNIDGGTSITNGTVTNSFAGGLLTQEGTNIGTYSHNDLSVVPELGVTLGYDVTCNLRLTFGYSFLYWSNVARPGDQIDTDVNPNLFPPRTGQGTSPSRPEFALRRGDIWAQGINFGLDYKF